MYLKTMYLKTITYLGTLVLLTSCFAGPVYQGEDMKNYDGRVFHNRSPMHKNPTDLIRVGWGALTRSKDWPEWRENEAAKIPVARVNTGIVVTYINHATTLIQVEGLNILTDPIYSDRASPVSFAGPKRIRAPGIAMSDLPEIDVILISHNHYDHLDTETLKQLAARHETKPLILSGLGVGTLLKEHGLNRFVDMQWGQTESTGDVEFVFVECRHRSGRGISDQMKTLWGSFVIKTPAGAIYFAGDTGYGPHLKEHGDEFGPFGLTILPIGAYEPRWFMADVHLNPAEAVQAHLDLNSEQSLSIHFGIFQLTYEGVDEPVDELNEALKRARLASESFWTLEPGEARQINPAKDDRR